MDFDGYFDGYRSNCVAKGRNVWQKVKLRAKRSNCVPKGQIVYQKVKLCAKRSNVDLRAAATPAANPGFAAARSYDFVGK